MGSEGRACLHIGQVGSANQLPATPFSPFQQVQAEAASTFSNNSPDAAPEQPLPLPPPPKNFGNVPNAGGLPTIAEDRSSSNPAAGLQASACSQSVELAQEASAAAHPRLLGSMDSISTLDHSFSMSFDSLNLSTQSCNPNQAYPPYGAKAICGKRNAMEDMFACIPCICEIPLSPGDPTPDRFPGRLADACHAVATSNGTNSPVDNLSPLTPSSAVLTGEHYARFNGSNSSQGACSSAEEREANTDMLHFFSVYDGHGGDEAAKHCANRLHQNLLSVLGRMLARNTHTDPSSGAVSQADPNSATMDGSLSPRAPNLASSPPMELPHAPGPKNDASHGTPLPDGKCCDTAIAPGTPPSEQALPSATSGMASESSSSSGGSGAVLSRAATAELPPAQQGPQRSSGTQVAAAVAVCAVEALGCGAGCCTTMPEPANAAALEQSASAAAAAAGGAAGGKPGAACPERRRAPLTASSLGTFDSFSSTRSDTSMVNTLEEALKQTFLRTDEEFSTEGCSAALIGSTAVVALVSQRKIYVANAGDSRAALFRNGKAIQLTDDHKPEREDEAVSSSSKPWLLHYYLLTPCQLILSCAPAAFRSSSEVSRPLEVTPDWPPYELPSFQQHLIICMAIAIF